MKPKFLKSSITACLILLTVLVFITPSISATAQKADPVVNAVLFYSPSCGHCEYVMSEVLPPLFEEYGYQLYILAVDMSSPAGQTLFGSALDRYGIPRENGYVPFLIVGETILVGSGEIPEQLPGIIERGVQEGGIAWPEIPGLAEVVDYQQTLRDSGASASQGAIQKTLSTMSKNFNRDLNANILSVIVLIGLTTSLIRSLRDYQRKKITTAANNQPEWLIPTLLGVGLVVAAYLTYIETTDTSAVCGPVGDCNTVQQSRYATLFGVMPVGLLGLFGYFLLTASWIITSFGPETWRNHSQLAFWLMALLGTIFSIYLTFLEPFVIGATCAWCLTSAVIMGVLLWLSTASGIKAYKLLAKATELETSNILAE